MYDCTYTPNLVGRQEHLALDEHLRVHKEAQSVEDPECNMDYIGDEAHAE